MVDRQDSGLATLSVCTKSYWGIYAIFLWVVDSVLPHVSFVYIFARIFWIQMNNDVERAVHPR